MEWFVEIGNILQYVLLPAVTIVLGLIGWRANADKRKLRIEVDNLQAENTSKEIENQSDWLDLYKKLHNDMAERLVVLESENKRINQRIKLFENALKKVYACKYYNTCPARLELSKLEASDNRQPARRKQKSNRQREPDSESDDPTGSGSQCEDKS